MKQKRNRPSVRPSDRTRRPLKTQTVRQASAPVRRTTLETSNSNQLPVQPSGCRASVCPLSENHKICLVPTVRVRCYQGVRTPTSLRDCRKLSENHKIKKAPWLPTVPRQRRQCARMSLCSNSTAPALFVLVHAHTPNRW